GGADEDRKPREEAAEGFHPQGRLRHHRHRAPLPRAADRRRSAAAQRQGRPAGLRATEESAGGEEAGGVVTGQTLTSRGDAGTADAGRRAQNKPSTCACVALSAKPSKRPSARPRAARRKPPQAAPASAPPTLIRR